MRSRVVADEAVAGGVGEAAGSAHNEQNTKKFRGGIACSKNTTMNSTLFLTRIAKAFGMRCGVISPIPFVSQARKGNVEALQSLVAYR